MTLEASQYPFPTVMTGTNEWVESVQRALRWNVRGAVQKGWDDGDECPSEEHESRVRCYQERDDSDSVITLPLFENNEMPYIIIVDGVDGAEANFTLSATCP